MTITASPTEASNFHIKLTDEDGYNLGLIVAGAKPDGTVTRDLKLLARTPVDRTAIKTSQGDTEYSDFRPPYYAMKQDDFSGGRGLDDFTKDRTRFYRSGGLNTRRNGFVHLQGQEQLAGLLRAGGQHQPINTNYPYTTASGSKLAFRWATKCTVSAGATAYDQIWIWSHLSTALTVDLYSGADATPWGTALASALTTTPPPFAPGWHVLNLSPALTLTTDGLWISVRCGTGTGLAGTRELAEDTSISGYRDTTGSPTAVLDKGFPCRILVKTEPSFGRFFEYKQNLYYVQRIGANTKLWINGYRGTLTAGATTTGTTTLNVALNALAGAVFKVIGGTGVNEARRWQSIASNTAGPNSVITFSNAYAAALDNTTEYVILGSNVWTEISSGSHALGNVSDVLVGSKGVVYFAQGSGDPIRRMREYTNAGTWTRDFADDSTNEASYLTEVGTNIWRVQNSNGEASAAPSQTWGTDLTFGAGVVCGDTTSAFTGMEAYTDDSGGAAPFVFKEEIAGYIETYGGTNSYIPLKVKEMASLRSEKNGRAHLVQDTYLYFSFANGLERYYNPIVSDIGPNRDEGMPSTQQGPIVALCGYPGTFFAGIDAGSTGYSTVLSYNGGWHEEYTGAYGQRILSLYSQPIPGTALDRLWVAAGGDVVWIPMPSETTNPLNDSNMLYRAGGYVETQTITTELKTILKYLSRLSIYFQSFLPDYMSTYYTYNGLTISPWPKLEDRFNVIEDSGVYKYDFTETPTSTPAYGIEAYSVKFWIYLYTTNRTYSPVMLAWVLELLARIENKYAYTIPFVLEGTATDPAKDLNGTNDDIPAASTKLNKLIDWAESGPLYMTSQDVRFNGKVVMLLPFSENLIRLEQTSGQVVYLGQLTLQDA